ncbi:hypothetical protein NLU13_5896 [Sarocladium strictum]|uniref:Major facilitator superfamily (MFS) profile domain-containing protein n=1 Tax=Sarocladium strictum TaxID=5046 RepID=A0AA39L6X4_SARSR|nr:hypothetical protein NLU13_5896 [Sarocladium strictum]
MAADKTEVPQTAVAAVPEFTKKEERRLLWKLDFFILTYSCFSYFFNFLDRGAFANAYVSGLKEDLHLEGNQYSVLLAMASVGLVLGQVPHMLVLQKVAPRIWLPSCVIVWGGLTMCSAACRTFSQFAVVRFFMGLVEASTYAGCVYILGSWYTPKELASRTAYFSIAGQLGTMFAGAMMTAIGKNMSGHSGLKGWQWVFLIDGIITCPIALLGYLTFPDTPETTTARYLSERERALALSRVPKKVSYSNNIHPVSLFKRVLATPAFWCLILFSIICAAFQGIPLQGLFLLYLKHYKGQPFTQDNITTYPLGIQAVGAVSELLVAWFLDFTGQRILTGVILAGIQIVAAAILLVPNVSYGAAFFAFYASGTAYAIQPLLYGWANVICIRYADDAKRGIILSSMAGVGIFLWTWWGIVLYPATDAPYWKKGCITMIVVSVAVVAVCVVVSWLDRHSLSEKAPLSEDESEAEAETGSGSASVDEKNVEKKA